MATPERFSELGGLRTWRQEEERSRGRIVHAFGLVQTRMGGSLLNPRYSQR